MGMLFPRVVSNLGNPDVRCRSRITICATGLSVVRRGWSRQRGNDNIDRPGNFVHGGSATRNIPVNKIV